MSREAMQMAIEALEDYVEEYGPHEKDSGVAYAITALRQALETEQQPVAWMHNFIENNVITHIPADIGRHPDRWTALYKDPTPCKTCQALAMAVMNDQTYHEKIIPKQWVGLTDEEVVGIGNASGLKAKPTSTGIIIHPDGIKNFFQAIEAKLREKNT